MINEKPVKPFITQKEHGSLNCFLDLRVRYSDDLQKKLVTVIEKYLYEASSPSVVWTVREDIYSVLMESFYCSPEQMEPAPHTPTLFYHECDVCVYLGRGHENTDLYFHPELSRPFVVRRGPHEDQVSYHLASERANLVSVWQAWLFAIEKRLIQVRDEEIYQ